jgi:hypothetical protein
LIVNPLDRPSVADLDPGSGAFLTTGSGIRIRDPGWKKIRIWDEHHFSGSLDTVFGLKILKFFDANPDPESGIFLIRDREWKNSRFNYLGSATLDRPLVAPL